MKIHLAGKMFIALLVILILVILAGVYKFNFTNSDIYVEDASGEVVPYDEYEDLSGDKSPSSDIDIIATNLNIPWDIAFLPTGGLLVTERSGALRHIAPDNTTTSILIEGVKHFGEGGLMGIALHPNFKENSWLYLYITKQGGAGTINSVERFTYRNGDLLNRTVIIGDIPGAIYHDGGRLAFGPDGYLYITTGDATKPHLAQDPNSLAGKILRVTDKGDAAPGNPFASKVYSLGHRNPQGLAWDEQGQLWSTEHGRSGLKSGLDEINKIYAGGNYGWPNLQGNDEQINFIAPELHSGGDTWAPASLVFVDDRIFFGGLRGEALYEAELKGGKLVLKEHFKKTFGRIRTVEISPDGEHLYITTSNRDGRGNPTNTDDRIIKINKNSL